MIISIGKSVALLRKVCKLLREKNEQNQCGNESTYETTKAATEKKNARNGMAHTFFRAIQLKRWQIAQNLKKKLVYCGNVQNLRQKLQTRKNDDKLRISENFLCNTEICKKMTELSYAPVA